MVIHEKNTGQWGNHLHAAQHTVLSPRLLLCCCRFYCGDTLEVVNFKLSPLPQYFIPEPGSISSYKDYILTLPTTDRPEAFGQHPNAEISYLIEDSKALLGGMLSLAPRTGGSTGGSGGAAASGGARQEELVEALANDLLDQVCGNLWCRGLHHNVCERGSMLVRQAMMVMQLCRTDIREGQQRHFLQADCMSAAGAWVLWRLCLSVLSGVWVQVPAPFNLEAVMKAKQDDPSALHVVLFQEVSTESIPPCTLTALCPCCWQAQRDKYNTTLSPAYVLSLRERSPVSQ